MNEGYQGETEKRRERKNEWGVYKYETERRDGGVRRIQREREKGICKEWKGSRPQEREIKGKR